jgi:4-amino-4-deoxy-L-arabinose transferase-like glycosyltransferase
LAKSQLGLAQILFIVGVSALGLVPGLASSGRLTYHEAIWAETGREMIQSGDLLVPTLGAQPWLEKPPLGTWLIAGSGFLDGGVTELTARLPSVIAAMLLAVGTGVVTANWFGERVGGVAGAIQATTLWTVMRGRLAEVDITLACLLTWALVAWDRMRDQEKRPRLETAWSWLFWILLGTTALAKGTGFGAVLIASVVLLSLVLERDFGWFQRLCFRPGWFVAGVLCLAWPVLVMTRYPGALALWYTHLADRLATKPVYFAGEHVWEYALGPLWQTLPWTPLVFGGAWSSFRRAFRHSGQGDRLLWAWAVGPAVLVSLATVKNAHYLIYALPPWSVWAALSLGRLQSRFTNQGWSQRGIQAATCSAFLGLGLAYGSGYCALGPYFDRRGKEWAFYEAAGKALSPSEPLALLYHSDDHFYPSLVGPVPHDLGIRLFYLGQPACVRVGRAALEQKPPAGPNVAYGVLARYSDESLLHRLGQVEILVRGPTSRSDRSYALFRVSPAFLNSAQTMHTSQENPLR